MSETPEPMTFYVETDEQYAARMKAALDEIQPGTQIVFEDPKVPGEWLITEIVEKPNGKSFTFTMFDPE